MSAESHTKNFRKQYINILSVLCYSHVFKYPLKAQEIFERSTLSSLDETIKLLEDLVQMELIYLNDSFYGLTSDIQNISSRLAGNLEAKRFLAIAFKITNYLKHIPFVSSIMLSGSLSKNYMTKGSDIDYFIITKPNRLWIVRAFFIAIHKVFFLNNSKYLCYNYMIDESNLKLQDENYYIGFEAVTVLPTYGHSGYLNFLKSNEWTLKYFPNYPVYQEEFDEKPMIVKKVFESIFNNRFGDWLDDWLLLKTQKRWNKRHGLSYKNDSSKKIELSKHNAQANTLNYYTIIMDKYLTLLKLNEAKLQQKIGV